MFTAMGTRDEGPEAHLIARLREALAEDPRVNVLDVQVTLARGSIYLHGQVSSPELRAAIEEVVRELVPPSMSVENDLVVRVLSEPNESGWAH